MRQTITAAALALFIHAFYLTSLATAADLSAATYLADIRSHGGKSVLAKEFDGENWKKIMHGIASADPDWLKVANELRPFASGAEEEDLNSSIGLALFIKPDVVFRSVTKRADEASLQAICQSQPIDADRLISQKKAFFSRRLSSVLNVEDKALAHQKEICMRSVREVLKRLDDRS